MTTCRDVVRQRTLLRAARGGDRYARARLTRCHLALVRSVASHYQGLGLPFEDLVQEGSVGLLEAINRYDPGRHASFEAFARFRIRRAIRNALTEQARLVRLPKQIVDRRRLLDRAEARFATANGRAPTPEELARAAALPLAAVLDARSAAIVPLSLDGRATDDGATLESLVADATASDPERDAIAADAAQRVRVAVAQLPRRQREIVSRHFGLDGSEEPIATVAADLHLSERRTRTIEHDALCRLASDLR
jgi:RNA polymerase primary sigma factor